MHGSMRQMPMIPEDGDIPPKIPEKSPKRLAALNARRPEHVYRGHRPQFRRRPAPAPNPRQPNWFVDRGGWCRVALFCFIAAGCIIAVVVGLVVGLRRVPQESSSERGSLPIRFPVGSYSFTTALSNTSTACTSNAATFRCFPYNADNNTSRAASAVTYRWTINEIALNQYIISAAPEAFAPQFANVPLTLQDLGLSSERLRFEIPMDDAVAGVPDGPVDGRNEASTCYFNGTVMSATVWTRKVAEFPANLTTTTGIDGDGAGDGNDTRVSENFDPWPYAIEIQQLVGSGKGVPDCRDAAGNVVGDFEAADGGGDCGCWYRNFALET
ncbi:hypothetical protein F5B20DRAFT_552348 [Whalleya microplaca]|nr:hypothetical protein F5B20DRAFT_552348 [Whalleya microplaca]